MPFDPNVVVFVYLSPDASTYSSFIFCFETKVVVFTFPDLVCLCDCSVCIECRVACSEPGKC